MPRVKEMNEINIPVMLKIKEAAKVTGLTEFRLRELIKENKIVYIRCGNRYFINMGKLAEYLNEGDPE